MSVNRIYQHFPDNESCIKHLESVMWANRPVCPYCRSTNSTPIKNEFRHHCNKCNTSFGITVGTVFHKSKLDLQKWFAAIYLLIVKQEKLSIRQLAKELIITKDTALAMSSKISNSRSECELLLDSFVKIGILHKQDLILESVEI